MRHPTNIALLRQLRYCAALTFMVSKPEGRILMLASLKKAVKSRALVFMVALGLALASLVATPVPKAGSCPEFVWTINFYTDDTYTVLCGQEIHPCCGGIVYHNGCRTDFRINTYEDCP